MSQNNNPKSTRGVTLRQPKDVRRVVQRIVSKAFQENNELEYANRISPLLNCWLKSWELDKIIDIEKRLTALETEKEKRGNKL